MNIYYVYAYKDPDTGVTFYVGKGKETRDRAHLQPYRLKQNSPKNNKILEILERGKEPIIERIQENLSETDALILERQLIEAIGKDNLTNQTLGGQGVSGFPGAMKGKTHTPETKMKQSLSKVGDKNPMWGKPRSEKALKMFKEKMSGENHPGFGKPQKDEVKQKISETLKGRKLSFDQIELRKKNMKALWERRNAGEAQARKSYVGENNPSYKKLSDIEVQNLIVAYQTNGNKIPMKVCRDLNISWMKAKRVLIEVNAWVTQ